MSCTKQRLALSPTLSRRRERGKEGVSDRLHSWNGARRVGISWGFVSPSPLPQTGEGTGSELVCGVGLFFHDRGPEQIVDLPLQRRTLVIAAIDRPCQLDEARTEVAAALAVTNLVLDLPERLIHPLQRRGQLPQRFRRRDRRVARRDQRRQLHTHVG